MKKKWCVIYTKTNYENKVAALLTKRKIENYCPINRIIYYTGDKKKILFEPLFSSYVFVYITDAEMALIRNIASVINFVYWMGNPAVIKNVEIDSIQHFASQHSNINLSKIGINNNGLMEMISQPSIVDNYQSYAPSVNTPHNKLLLPSMGCMMTAEIEKSSSNVSVYGFGKVKMIF